MERMMTRRAGGANVGVGTGVNVSVGVNVNVAVDVAVSEGVTEGVNVELGVELGARKGTPATPGIWQASRRRIEKRKKNGLRQVFMGWF
jgi:hypothetical protein